MIFLHLLVLKGVLGFTVWESPRLLKSVEVLMFVPEGADFYHRMDTPFVLRGLVSDKVAYGSDAWLQDNLYAYSIPQVESQLKENRSSSNFYRVPWLAFLQVYAGLGLYAASQMPPPLRAVLQVPPFLLHGNGFDLFLSTPFVWLSANRSQSVIHRDSDENVHCVLDGSKKFLLWQPSEPIANPENGWIADGKAMGGYGEWSGVDVDAVQQEFAKGWSGTMDAFESELFPGDCIFIPSGWFHYVESAKSLRTLSYHVWFKKPPILITTAKFPPSTTFDACAYKDDVFQATQPEFVAGTSSKCFRN
jgi:hypothetical protein